MVLEIAQRLNLDLVLTVGATNESVQVQATAAQLLQTEEASTGQVIDTQVIEQTPLDGRNYVFIAQFAAGVQENNSYYTGQKTGGAGFIVNGVRTSQTNFVLDGLDNNTSSVDFLNGAQYAVRPPPDALEEFKIQTTTSAPTWTLGRSGNQCQPQIRH